MQIGKLTSSKGKYTLIRHLQDKILFNKARAN
ncbi:hypothetical protein EHW99_1594 [Erwinia amylovora]|uniref:Uncharacterized protein n=3 Tax=Erwinia amylovora TaxID=552 RepID=A0A831A593_ERWAM|nr:hypothetical protein EaACW_2003 [Erwinia amylovora ACW56400]QJQ54298.1 hypothetical protein EHX00_1594 [Erwinia amylovora]CBA20941.1 hypothetical protein predicted by Glimmer/Critica [Erwinia amylovora CFBP1430]CBX80865.1 hypothetical protein predicted by Glimmer/Critica [Erwinia amylovora ATCC BAA-2158]CCO78850.1 hypothetical protein BN432_2053 [Erwinia amylovora Ea356]CCO82647.1 hypothetical protein BN433_2077 [Erwinia amylovora Ea266]CCO86429.1 hypothetical protein BN434_2042 [Erwinia a